MSLFKHISKKEAEAQTGGNQGLFAYAQKLKSEFGLIQVNGTRWSFTGISVDNIASEISGPEICLEALKMIKEEVLPYSQVVIMTDLETTLLVCNTKPRPTGFLSVLDPNGIADLISAVVKASGEKAIEYENTWLFTLPP